MENYFGLSLILQKKPHLCRLKKRNMNIIFMGTPDFAVESLKILVENHYNIVAVVTTPDKPAGRGQKLSVSAVKQYALSQNLNVLQPDKLKNQEFLEELHALKPDLQIVVAFRMLPVEVWSLPSRGTFNLHASLLPNYRGAAPINWAVINGEKETGATTFFIEHQIDTGNIILQKTIPINAQDSAGDVHDKLMMMGANLVLETVRLIEQNQAESIPQSKLVQNSNSLKAAPKIFKEHCKINWALSAEKLHNFIRGLSPYPSAWTEIKSKKTNEIVSAKIFKTNVEVGLVSEPIGALLSDGKSFLKIASTFGYLHILSLQLAGKKQLNINEFLRGFPISDWEINI